MATQDRRIPLPDRCKLTRDGNVYISWNPRPSIHNGLSIIIFPNDYFTEIGTWGHSDINQFFESIKKMVEGV